MIGRGCARAFAIAALVHTLPAMAQVLPGAAAGPASGNAAPPAAEMMEAPYQDRLIGGGALEPLPPAGEGEHYNADGLPRYWRLEAVTSNTSGTGGTQHQNALRFSGNIDTPDYGVFTVDATLQSGPGSSTFTLWQRGMPFDGGWRANNSLGVVNTAAIDLTRAQYRFYLPTFPILGATTEWLQNNALQLQASVGEPGTFSGLLVSGFSTLHGTIATAGAQWAFAPQWRAGVQVTSSSGVELESGGGISSGSFTGDAVFASASWQGKYTRLQLNVLDSEANEGRKGVGLWVDGETMDGRYVHHYGAFRLEPDLFWGYQPISSNQQGAYYRINFQNLQWNWDGGVDVLNSVEERGTTSTFATGSVRYQFDRQIGAGVAGSMRHDTSTAWSGQAFVQRQSNSGTDQAQLSAAEQNDDRIVQLLLDHSWPMQVDNRLSTSIGGSRETVAGRTFNTASFIVYGGGNFGNDLTIDGNLRFAYTRNNGSATGVFANLNAIWRLDTHWSLVGTAYDNRDATARLLTVESPIQSPTALPTPSDRALFLTLRYEERAGRPSVPLGGPPGSGAGSVVGFVFLDANDNTRYDGDESGAQGVTVLLDGRFSARTDARGRFEFPLVAAGPHTITVVPDNLPLPWAVSDNGRRNVVVRTRETTMIDIPAGRIR